MARRVDEGVPSPGRVCDEDHAVDLQLTDQGLNVGHVVTEPVPVLGRPVAVAVAPRASVSRICQELDVVVDGFMGRPLGGGPYPYLWLDALTQKVREDGRIVNVSVVVATAVSPWVRKPAGWSWWYRTLIRERRSLQRSQLATVPQCSASPLLGRPDVLAFPSFPLDVVELGSSSTRPKCLHLRAGYRLARCAPRFADLQHDQGRWPSC